MEHDAVVEVLRNVIASREDSEVSRDPEDYDLEAIAREVEERTRAAEAVELDRQEYWRIIEKHARS